MADEAKCPLFGYALRASLWAALAGVVLTVLPMSLLHCFEIGQGLPRDLSLLAVMPGALLLLSHYYVDEVPPLALHCVLNWLGWYLGLMPFILLGLMLAGKRHQLDGP